MEGDITTGDDWYTRMLYFCQVHWTQILVNFVVLSLIPWPLFIFKWTNKCNWDSSLLISHYAHENNNNRKTSLKRDAPLWGSNASVSERHPHPPFLNPPLSRQGAHRPGTFSTKMKQINAEPAWRWSDGCGQWPSQASSPVRRSPGVGENDAELPGCSRLSGSWQTQAPIGTTPCSWSDPHEKLDSAPWECSFFLPLTSLPLG